MTGLQLAPDSLERQIPDLLAGHSVVALVPAAGFPAWSAMNAWRVARAAAAAGRRTALVDCVVDEPLLHTIAGAANDEGIVDAFVYGTSLNRIAQQQPEPNLFFIPAGTFAPDPVPVLANPRWRRLSAGFRHESALLLLFVPSESIEVHSADLDGLIVLAPQGMDLAVAEAPGVTGAMGRGLPLLAVVGDVPPGAEASGAGGMGAVAPGAPVVADVARGAAAEAPRPATRRRATAPMALLVPEPRRPPWALYVVVLVLALGAGSYLYRDDLLKMAGLAPEPPVRPFVHRPPPPHPVDSLDWVVQVSAWPALDQALAAADTLEARGAAAFVTPIRLRGRRTWYRVHVGPMAARAGADSVLAALRARGHVTAGASVVKAPLSVALVAGLTLDSARAERARLRAAGLPVFALGQADRTFRVFAGAFEDSTQAALLTGLITSAGGTGELVPRVGFVP